MDIGDNYVVHFAAFQFEFYSFFIVNTVVFYKTIVQHLCLDYWEISLN